MARGTLRMWVGNYDGRRMGAVVATTIARAATAAGVGAREFGDFWVEQANGVDPALKPDTLYTKPYDARQQAWSEGRCAVPDRRRAR